MNCFLGNTLLWVFSFSCSSQSLNIEMALDA
jgi:hypothetical protein